MNKREELTIAEKKAPEFCIFPVKPGKINAIVFGFFLINDKQRRFCLIISGKTNELPFCCIQKENKIRTFAFDFRQDRLYAEVTI